MLYYLGELTEKIAAEDRIQVLKAAQAKLKVPKSCEILLRIFNLLSFHRLLEMS